MLSLLEEAAGRVPEVAVRLDGPSREELQKTPLNEIRVSYFSYDKSLNEQ